MRFKSSRVKHLTAIAAVLLSVSTAAADDHVNWLKLPLSCLPERAAKWTGGQNEAPCHCPPTSMCPTTYAEYSDNNLAKMPWMFVQRCCPVITNPNPTCPDGSPMPADGNCNVASDCPSKYYPTLKDSGITNGNSNSLSGHYTEGGQTYNFSDISGGGSGSATASYAMRLGSRYNFSLRGITMLYWVWGPNFCHTYGNGAGAMGGGDLSQQMCAVEGFDDGNGYGGVKGYAAMTNGANNVSGPTLASIIGGGGADNLTWFGFSVARPDQLPNNLVKNDVLTKINAQGSDIVQIADNGWHDSGGGYSTGYSTSGSYGFREVHDNVGLESEHKDFVSACRSVAGEYVTVINNTVGGKSCPYLQCRYVYDTTMESCLAAGTKITLADGSSKAVEDVKLGETVKGADGTDHKVGALNAYQSRLRVLYGINGAGPTLTGDHPIKTTEGWKAITDDAAKLYADKEGFAKEPLKVGDEIVTEQGKVKVTSIKRFAEINPITTYNLRVEGDDSFYANGMAVKGFNHMEMHY